MMHGPVNIFSSHFDITHIETPTRHSEHFYTLIKHSAMAGSTSLKTLTFSIGISFQDLYVIVEN